MEKLLAIARCKHLYRVISEVGAVAYCEFKLHEIVFALQISSTVTTLS